MTRTYPITGATGHQGSGVISALLSQPADMLILAVTRDPTTPRARDLAAKSPLIKLVKGDLNDVPALFRAAQAISPEIHGVFSVQAAGVGAGSNPAASAEVRQGVALIDVARTAGVEHFVYSSADRGGEKSWDNPTNVGFFRTKHLVEQLLAKPQDSTGHTMGWTILRPTTFMQNLSPTFQSRALLALLRDGLGGKPIYWISTDDIGWFAADAFANPDRWKGRAVALAGDELTFDQLNDVFVKATGGPVPTAPRFVGALLGALVGDLGRMVRWLSKEGCLVDVEALREMHPGLMDVETWLREKSRFSKVQRD